MAPSDTFVCACKEGNRPASGSVARFRSGIFPAAGNSMVTVSFWYNIYRPDGGELQVFIMNHGSTNDKRMLMRKRSEARGWRRADFNESVSEPFQLIFEATVGETQNSGVALSNLSFTVYSPRKFTGRSEHGGIVDGTSTLPVEGAGNISQGITEDAVHDRPSLAFLIAIVASSAVVVILILFVVVVVCLVRKIRILSSTAHPYEEISSNKSERGTMEIAPQKDVFINENGSTLPRWKHLSYLSAHDSNRSSIYAEITEAEERRSRFHRSGTGTTGDSFVTAYSLQHLIDRANANVITKSTETSRRQSESGWVDNVIYESGSDMRELAASEDKPDREVPTYRRFTGPGAFGFGGINAGWIEDLSRSRTL
ncbi:uncharacterized protein LOC121430878 [Lytechinus variegatus]|uniref:uncharacterized protein LOC121430878 n=1 Tax=Lytechinus variegatus TaxID=7654 RepID=UPI001BB24679|nr:uncharacterized protein LOC121430878 [Lytechinus variegatus]